MQTCTFIIASFITMHAWVYPSVYRTGWQRSLRDWALEIVLERLVRVVVALNRRKREM